MKDKELQSKMVNFFYDRTNKHISMVQENCAKIEHYDKKKFKGLIEQAKEHDATKFNTPEFYPYLYITWVYKCKEEGEPYEAPVNLAEKMVAATAMQQSILTSFEADEIAAFSK